MPVNGLRIAAGVVAAAGLLVAGFLVLRDGGDEQRPVRDRLPIQPTVVGKSVLVDVSGAVLEEFNGDCVSSRVSYLCLRVRDELLAADEHLLARGGLTIRTTVDRRLQQSAQQAIDRRVRSDDKPIAALAMVVPGTGDIRAMATNRPLVDKVGALAYQQGSTAMVYTLAAALESGLRFEDGFPYAAAYRAPSYSAFKNCKGENVADPVHSVVNAKRDHSDFTTLRSGTWAAENTFFVRLTEEVGLCESVTMARRLGLARADGQKVMEYETFSLGVNEVDPVMAAGTYATLAARGKQCEPRAVAEVSGGSKVLRSFPPRCRDVLDPAVADAVTNVLADGLARGPLKGLGRDAAGMAGASDGYTAAWYAGYTPDLASAVALGVPGRDAFDQRLVDVILGGRRYERVEGTSIPGPIWKESMTAALSGLPGTAFTKPDTARFGGCRDRCAN
ncbi:hypothetical protein [Nonomuraea turcica]|uniref:hypothetical protein n=1 Tax=Nonomuraea sp. G32 TaxID=3067274 RepID=UPI00273A8222|nr:hypothetical protein [Nonomuraea sp. G32]MDP4502078.1 hypothetical protein [Nonomuraea sp. G32]